MLKNEWIRCPVCGSKTRDRLREDTVLKNYPLYCPKCKQDTLVNAKELSIRNVPRCGKQRLPRILRLHSVPFYCGWGLSDRNIRMSGNICLPTWKGIGRGDMTAVSMNV